MVRGFNIRKIREGDFAKTYKFARSIREFKVSANHPFMEPDEFRAAMQNKAGVFLVSEIEGKIVALVYAHTNDIEQYTNLNRKRSGKFSSWACLVYLGVKKKFRGQGLASQLYNSCVLLLKNKGISNIYSWANIESNKSIVGFLQKKGFQRGHKYIWMDKKI